MPAREVIVHGERACPIAPGFLPGLVHLDADELACFIKTNRVACCDQCTRQGYIFAERVVRAREPATDLKEIPLDQKTLSIRLDPVECVNGLSWQTKTVD